MLKTFSCQHRISIAATAVFCLFALPCFNAMAVVKNNTSQEINESLKRQNYADEMQVLQIVLSSNQSEAPAIELLLGGVPSTGNESRQSSATEKTKSTKETKQVLPQENYETQPDLSEIILGSATEKAIFVDVKKAGFYIAYESKEGIRAVTGLVEDDLSNGWLVVKKWNRTSDQSPRQFDTGTAHNQLLDFQLSDRVVRKKPGRTTYGAITLKPYAANMTDDVDVAYNLANRLMTVLYPNQSNNVLPNELASPIITNFGAGGYIAFKMGDHRYFFSRAVNDYLQSMEDDLLFSRGFNHYLVNSFRLDQEIQKDPALTEQEAEFLLATNSLARATTDFWNATEGTDLLTEDSAKRKKGKIWADIGGFVAGFVGALVYNNNNGGGTDVNPFTTGTSVSSAASALADKKKE